MKTPWLIQRCELGDGKFRYDYMGSSEFEWGDQAESLKRIFASGMRTDSATMNIEGKEVVVHMLAGEGFAFVDYQPYLRQLAEDELRLQEQAGFDEAVKAQVGIKSNRRFPLRTNVWFDFRNDVLWTLTEDNLGALVSFLEDIKGGWALKRSLE